MPSLVSCWNCNVQYAASAGQCPGCGAEYAPTQEERIRVAFDDAVQRLEQGELIERVQHLVSRQHGLNDESVAAVMKAAALRERESSKKHGQHIAKSGCLLVLSAIISVVAGSLLIALFCLLLGGAMFCFGVVQSWTGWKVAGNDAD